MFFARTMRYTGVPTGRFARLAPWGHVGGVSSTAGQFAANFTHAAYTSAPDSGTATLATGSCISNGTCDHLYVWNLLCGATASPTSACVGAGGTRSTTCTGSRWDGTSCSSTDGYFGPRASHTRSLVDDTQNQVIMLFGGQNGNTPRGCAATGLPVTDTTSTASYPYANGSNPIGQQIWNSSNCNSLPNTVWIYSVPNQSWTLLTNAGDVPAGHQRPAIDHDSHLHYFVYWTGPWGAAETVGEYDHGLYKMTVSCTPSCASPTGGTSTWTAVSTGLGLPTGASNNSLQQIGIPWNQQYVVGPPIVDHCHKPGDALYNECDGGYENLVFDSKDNVHLYIDAYGGAGNASAIPVIFQLPESAID